MKKALNVFLAIICLYIGAILLWSPKHPVYSSVEKVRKNIISYYESNDAVPSDLSFLQDEKLKEDIRLFQITWNPETREIKSKGNWTYVPDIQFRLTFGLLGNPRERNYGDPSIDLSSYFPAEAKVEPVVSEK